jgi:hypothetical protein
MSRIAPCSALSRESPLELLDGPDADAVKLRELDDANAGLEIGDDGRGLVGWNVGRPNRTPQARARACPARTRSRIISRSNSANTPAICSSAFPPGVVVSTACA